MVQLINIGSQNKQFSAYIKQTTELKEKIETKEKYKDQMDWLHPLADRIHAPVDYLTALQKSQLKSSNSFVSLV